MKKFLYVFIGMAIALGAVVLYSFKAKENAEVSYAIVVGYYSTDKITIYYGNGAEENAADLLSINIGWNRDKGKTPFVNSLAKTLSYLGQKGYRVIEESQGSAMDNNLLGISYTLIKEN